MRRHRLWGGFTISCCMHFIRMKSFIFLWIEWTNYCYHFKLPMSLKNKIGTNRKNSRKWKAMHSAHQPKSKHSKNQSKWSRNDCHQGEKITNKMNISVEWRLLEGDRIDDDPNPTIWRFYYGLVYSWNKNALYQWMEKITICCS